MRWNSILPVCIFSATFLVSADVAKVGVFVVDDRTGEPMKDVSVTGSFRMDNGWLAFKGGEPPNRDSAVTDVNGRCRLRGRTNCGRMGVWARNPPSGYYAPRRGWGRRFSEKNFLGIWQPDNLVATIRLQRVEHPIPLFVKACKLDVKREIADVNGGRVARLR